MFRGNLDFVPMIVLCGAVEFWLLALSIHHKFRVARSYVQHSLRCLCKVCINVWLCVHRGNCDRCHGGLKGSIMMVVWKDCRF